MVAAANAAAPPARSAAAAAAASDAGVMALLELVPKRRGKPSGMKHCQTMAELAAATGQCGCRTSKAAADPPQSCPYYDREGGPTRLLSFHEAPAVLRFNTYIRSGYRAGMGYRDCCRSVLQLHNETGNIWLHLAPVLLLLALWLGGALEAWQGARLAYAVNVGSIAACFLLSVAYHTCMAHHHTHDAWLHLDVCGILLVLVGGGHMVLWWGLWCWPAWRALFCALYYACGVAGVAASLRASSALGRGLPMLGLLAVRLASFAARGLLEARSGAGLSEALCHYVAMEACSLAGGLLNVARIPERWVQPEDPAKPAPLDYVFNSHQIMHVLVALAMWQLHLGASDDYRSVAALLVGAARCPPRPASALAM